MDAKIAYMEAIEDTIVSWLVDVAIQERGMHDVFALDEHFDKKLSTSGLVERAYDYLSEHTTIFDAEDQELIDEDDYDDTGAIGEYSGEYSGENVGENVGEEHIA